MSFDPNNFMLFYLILAIFALAIAIVIYAAYRGESKHRPK